MKGLHMVAWILVIVGGLNWLLQGVVGADIGALLLGGMDAPLAKVVYVLVGVAALYELITHKQTCKVCNAAPASTPPPATPNAM